MLPSHWKELPAETESFDDGRDYNKCMFIRNDGLARIYYNEGEEGTPEMFGISFDDGDGDCADCLEEAIAVADTYINKFLINRL